MDEKRLNILENIIKTLQDGVTQSEFVAAFERVVSYIKDFQDQIATALETASTRINELHDRVEQKLASVKDGKDGRTPVFISQSEPKDPKPGDIWYQP